MRSKPQRAKGAFFYALRYALCSLLFAVMISAAVYAAVLERVVAYVNDTAITLSEFRENALRSRKTLRNVSDEEIINSMINRLLLLQEAEKMRIEAPGKDELVREYIDIKIKSSIIISDEDIEHFYKENSGQFNGQDYFAVRDDIEKYLFELEVNKQLKRHIEELRAKADIKIQLQVMGDGL